MKRMHTETLGSNNQQQTQNRDNFKTNLKHIIEQQINHELSKNQRQSIQSTSTTLFN
jgi:hypothetical protein